MVLTNSEKTQADGSEETAPCKPAPPREGIHVTDGPLQSARVAVSAEATN